MTKQGSLQRAKALTSRTQSETHMKLRSVSFAVILILVSSIYTEARVTAHFEAFTTNSVKYMFVQDGLNITYAFDQDVSAYDQSTITYHKIQGGNALQDVSPKLLDSKTPNSTTFSIPATFYSDADSVEFFMTLKRSDGPVFTSSKTTVDVSNQNRLRRILAKQPNLVRFSQKLIEADD